MNPRGRLSFTENGKETNGRRAFSHGDRIGLSLYLPRSLGAVSAIAHLKNEHTGDITEYGFQWSGAERDFDLYTLSFDTADLSVRSGLFFLRIDIESVCGYVCAQRAEGDSVSFAPLCDSSPFSHQITVSDFEYPPPDWLRGGVIYHVFVDRFYRGKETPARPDSIMLTDWDNGIPEYPEYPGAHLENNTFFGGNLWGVIDKLDYIASLGTRAIYLSPIFEAYSNHKYDTGNYMKVDDAFGGEEALCALIAEAKKRGIGIILDGVFNHTGADSIYFNKFGKYDSVGAYQSKDSPYYGWFDFQWHPYKYTCWWDIDILPRINTAVPECREYFLGNNGVIRHYAKMGIAGMRLDVVDELSDDFVSGIKSVLASENSGSVLYGEVWEDASNKIAYGTRKKYYLGCELDGVMNYPYRTGIIDYLRQGRTDTLSYALSDVLPNMPKRIRDLQMNLLGTHDTERIITALAAPNSEGKSNAELSVFRMNEGDYALGIKRLKLAYLILSTLPGIPTVYYGDEVGVEGYKDPFNRTPYPWNKQNEELLDFYRQMGNIRASRSVYADGEFSLICLDSECLAFSREKNGRAYVTLVNNSSAPLYVFADGARAEWGTKIRKGRAVIAPLSGAIISIPLSQISSLRLSFENDE